MRKSWIALATWAFMGVAAWAAEPQEMGRVISTQPVIHQVQVPQQVCNQVPMAVAEPNSAPLLVEKIEGQNMTINPTSCHVQMMTHNTTAYQVEYEYAGRRYTVELPYDPGPSLALSVSPVVSAPPAGYPPPTAAVPPPMTAPTPVMVAPPVMPAPVYVAPYPYYGYPYGFYPGVGISLGFGYHRHFRR